MNNDLIILEPAAPVSAASVSVQATLGDLSGKVIGFIDNSKPNFDYLADDLGNTLMARYGAKAVVKHRKRAASVPASPEVLADIEEKCDLVIAGSGD